MFNPLLTTKREVAGSVGRRAHDAGIATYDPNTGAVQLRKCSFSLRFIVADWFFSGSILLNATACMVHATRCERHSEEEDPNEVTMLKQLSASVIATNYIATFIDFDTSAPNCLAVCLEPATCSLSYVLFHESHHIYFNDAAVVVRVLRDVLEALHFVHSQGMVYRALSPHSVMMFVHGGSVVRFKLCDFSLAHFSGETHAKSRGMLPYQAPEVLNKRVITTKSDMYAVGILCYELHTY